MANLIHTLRIQVDRSTSDEEEGAVYGYTIYTPQAPSANDGQFDYLARQPLTVEGIVAQAVEELDFKHREEYDQAEPSELYNKETVIVPLPNKGYIAIDSAIDHLLTLPAGSSSHHWRRHYSAAVLPFEINRATLHQFSAMCRHFNVRWERMQFEAKDDGAYPLLVTDEQTFSNLVTMVNNAITLARFD